MEYRKLGRSGLKVSTLCLGTMTFGGPTGAGEAGEIVAAARAAGVNFIDTADSYTGGESERITGRAIAADRDRWVLATKIANPKGDDINARGLSRRWVAAGADACLRRLGTGHIDILYLHKEDHETALEETVGALGDLIRAGKIRYFGLSNYRSWRVAEICHICDRLGIDRPVVSQPYYNALNRMPEVEHLPACGFYGLGVVPYSPLSRGVLTAKYRPGEQPGPDTRVGRGDKRVLETEWRPESLEIAAKIRDHAAAQGAGPVDIAVNWLLNNRLVTAIVAGPRTLAQWQGYLGALDYRFTAEDERLIDSLVAPGHPSTPGFNDPAYPLEGRPVRIG